MYAVGKLSSYITQGVYTVSGPFHPFGGAVDMVVVQQQDGSLKSSPWYVKFGKFQGVLKAKERVVDINVNGVDADFHMYLDPRGEAYFLREIDSEEATEGVSSHSSMCEEIDPRSPDKIPFKSKSMNYDLDNSVSDASNVNGLDRNNSKRSRILGFVLGRRSMKEQYLPKEENDSNANRIASIERAEIAADLLEMKWSTNLKSRSKKKECRESSNDSCEITGGRLETSLVLHEQHFVNKLESSGVDKTIEEHKGSNCVSRESSRTDFDSCSEAESGLIKAEGPVEIVTERCTEVETNEQGDVVSCSSVALSVCQTEDNNSIITKEVDEIKELKRTDSEFQDVPGDSVMIKEVSEQIIVSDVNDAKPSITATKQEVDQINGPDRPRVRIFQQHLKVESEGLKGNVRRCPSSVDISKRREVSEKGIGRKTKSLPNMRSQIDDSFADNHEDPQFYSPVTKFKSSNWDLVREDASRLIKANLEKEKSADNLLKDLKDGSIASGSPSDIVDGAGGSWSLWPFKRSVNKAISPKDENSKKDSDLDSVADTDTERETPSPQSSKMHTRALTPTPEQLASLNLAEGQNTVTFTFSTSVLGPQKVDARIYLWRWDTRIVISDVDGTITKSDVLGQFMPLVGRDWSHIGVTHLFSGIKENGYQMLYLSARAISQASITRQFLFNLKQDGKALPDGPVVISPDGLFPSLFREVIRRAPHEFKIACLEDIKACFPPDRNPFYAGFGNRDTDEFSYLKVGIPKGKIFIINPKGEVVVNRCIDSKSYASLHALVNDIFPPISVHEEEDYNSWNFWKLPPPDME